MVCEWSARFLTFDIVPRSLRVNFLINRIEWGVSVPLFDGRGEGLASFNSLVDTPETDVANYCHGERTWQAMRSAGFVLDDRQASQRTIKAKPIYIAEEKGRYRRKG